MSARTNPSVVSFKPTEFWKQWCARKPGEKNLHVMIAALMLCAAYFALIHPLTSARIDKIDYDMSKQRAREKAVTRNKEAAVVQPPDIFAGKSLPEARQALSELQQQLEETRDGVQRYESAFVSLDDTLAMNVLKTGLTALAEAGDMEVLSVEHVYRKSEDSHRLPTPQLIRESAEANPYKRPLLKMRARASYRGLMQFLNGLTSLPYIAAPVSSQIDVGIERNPETRMPVRQWLDIEITFAV